MIMKHNLKRIEIQPSGEGLENAYLYVSVCNEDGNSTQWGKFDHDV
jgi:hypothetical protein